MKTQTYRDQLIALLKLRGTMERAVPVRLATGEETKIYLDVKGVLHDGEAMLVAAKAMIEHLVENKVPYTTAVGGPTMGADILAHTLVVIAAQVRPGEDNNWFSIRDHIKTDHGMGKLIEGYDLGPADTVVITDDVANSGKSLVEAVEAVRATGATVLAVVPLVDRSDQTAPKMAELGVPYLPVLTSADLGLAPLRPATDFVEQFLVDGHDD